MTNELKIYSAHIFELGCMDQQVYIKAEADKVIAEKDTKIIQLEALIENYNRISREIINDFNYQKYKRCLLMAKWCKDMSVWWNDEQVSRLKEQKGNYKSRRFQKAHTKFVFFYRWQERWLKIAKQLKKVIADAH